MRIEELRIDSGEWGVESGEWGVESGEWGVESGEWRMGSGEWTPPPPAPGLELRIENGELRIEN